MTELPSIVNFDDVMAVISRGTRVEQQAWDFTDTTSRRLQYERRARANPSNDFYEIFRFTSGDLCDGPCIKMWADSLGGFSSCVGLNLKGLVVWWCSGLGFRLFVTNRLRVWLPVEILVVVGGGLVACPQRWTWVGSIRGLGWVGLGEENWTHVHLCLPVYRLWACCSHLCGSSHQRLWFVTSYWTVLLCSWRRREKRWRKNKKRDKKR